MMIFVESKARLTERWRGIEAMKDAGMEFQINTTITNGQSAPD